MKKTHARIKYFVKLCCIFYAWISWGAVFCSRWFGFSFWQTIVIFMFSFVPYLFFYTGIVSGWWNEKDVEEIVFLHLQGRLAILKAKPIDILNTLPSRLEEKAQIEDISVHIQTYVKKLNDNAVRVTYSANFYNKKDVVTYTHEFEKSN